jgi:hypothetical protein
VLYALFLVCITGQTLGLIAYYAFAADAPLLDEAFTLGDLLASGSPYYITECALPGSQCAALSSTGDSSGGGQYFRVNPVSLGSAGFSICTWFVFDATTYSARIFDFGAGRDNNNVVLFRSGWSDVLYVYYSCGYGNGYFHFPNPIINGQWRHVCVVNQGKSWSFYDNGVFAASQTASCSLSNVLLTSNFIGRSNWYADSLLIGRVDEFRIYQKALLYFDVAGIYNGLKPAGVYKHLNCLGLHDVT